MKRAFLNVLDKAAQRRCTGITMCCLVSFSSFCTHRFSFALFALPIILLSQLAISQTVLDMCDLTAREKSTKVALTWTHNGSSLYKLYRSTQGAKTGYSQIATTNSTYSAYTDNSVKVNTQYFYYIEGHNGSRSPVVSVIPRNRARNMWPDIISQPVTQAIQDQLYIYDIVASDPDEDQLTFYLDMAPSGMSINAATGRISWTPNEADVGAVSVSIRVSDGYLCDVQCVSINVLQRLRATPEVYPDSGIAPLTVRFKTKGVSPHSTINWYRWDFEGDGTWNASTQIAPDYTFTYNITGVYYPLLEVVNMLGETDRKAVKIKVVGPPPTATATASPTNGASPLQVTFSGTGTKSAGQIKYHKWDLDGDGTIDTIFRINPDTILLFSDDFEADLTGWDKKGTFGEIGIFNWQSVDYALTAKLPKSGMGSANRYVTSPQIDLTGSVACTLSFWSDFNPQGTSITGYIYVVKENGSTALLQSFTSSSGRSTGNRAINLSSYSNQKIQLRFQTNTSSNIPWWQVDDIKITDGAGEILFVENGSSTNQWDYSQSASSLGFAPKGVPQTGNGKGWLEPDPSLFTYQNNMDCHITTPSIALPSEGALWLRYWQYMVTTDNGDGGIVELSVNNGSFNVILPSGGYPGIINERGDGFTGNLGVTRPLFDLAAYAGKNIKLRFSFYSNDTGADRGWLIDSVRVCQVLPVSSGVSGATSRVVKVFDAPGMYNATLQVVDSEGQIGSASAMATVIQVGPSGTPTVNATVTPLTGNAPLAVTFRATGTDPGGKIMLYEWDFDNDGVYDWSSTANGNTSSTFTKGGPFVAVVRVTDNDGMTSRQFFDVMVNVSATLAIPETDRTFNPYNSETMVVRTTIGGQIPVTVYIKEKSGNVIRTLVDWTERVAGTYNDIWDGRDNGGNLLKEGAYYAVMEYRIGGQTKMVDLTNSTGGQQYNPPRSSSPNYNITPYNNIQQTIPFTISKPSEVTLFMGLLNSADKRIRTILNRVPFGAGSYTVYWDGLTDDGLLPLEYSGEILPGIWGFYLPDNAMYLKGDVPQVTDLSISPSHFAPLSEACGPSGEKSGISITYNLSANASGLKMNLYSIETGQSVIERIIPETNAGQHTVFWSGRDLEGKALDKGAYRLGLTAFDEYGNQSLVRYNLMKTLYAYQPVEE